MNRTLVPDDVAQARDIVASAASEGRTLDITAGGSKRPLGRPQIADLHLSLERLTGVIDYEPSELVLTARAATPLAEIETLLDANRQMLAFEPPGWPSLFGDRQPTLGGTVACNVAGPARVRAGAARDHFLGFSAINGRGEIWKAGGRVVKNVTGYDMCKLQAGAFGTLSILTELSVRVAPKPETARTLVFAGLDDHDAVVLLARALNTPHEVAAAAHIPRERRTAIRIEGPAPSVAFRSSALEALLGAAECLDEAASRTLWTGIGGVQPLLPLGERVLWRLCPTPSEAPAITAAIARARPDADWFYDWAGGLVWLSLDPTEDAGAAVVRGAMTGGHATLFVAPDTTRARVAVFDELPGPLASLSRRVKDGFDPLGILNPGRMQAGR